jgi:hypothetical protein
VTKNKLVVQLKSYKLQLMLPAGPSRVGLSNYVTESRRFHLSLMGSRLSSEKQASNPVLSIESKALPGHPGLKFRSQPGQI